MGLNERIQSLPPDMQAEVADFVEYLHQKRARQQEASSADKSLAAVKALKGLGSESPQAMGSDASRPSIVQVLAQAPGHLDAHTVIYAIEGIEPYASFLAPLWSATAGGQLSLISSELTWLETLTKP